MSTFKFANNVQTTLAAPITTVGQTSITLSSAANLPTLTGGQVMALTLNDASSQSVFEIVYVTAIVGAVLTVIRGQEGTVANAWLANDNAYASDTAAILNSFALVTSTNTFTAGQIVAWPQSAATVPSQVIGFTGQSVDLWDVFLTQGGTKAIFVDKNGVLNFGLGGASLPNAPSIVAGGSGNMILNTTSGQALQFGSGALGVNIWGQFAATGAFVVGSTTANAQAQGDIAFGRSAAGAFMFWGQSATTAGQMDFGQSAANTYSFKSNPSSPGYAPVSGGAYTNLSDERAKTNIAPLAYGLNEIMALNPISFTINHTGQDGLGFSAQQVERILPELVSTDNDGIMGICYDGIIPVLVKHCQDEVAIRKQMQAALKAAGVKGF